MIAIAILIGVIFMVSNSQNKKSPEKKPDTGIEKPALKTFQGFSSGYDPIRQVHWTREDTMEFREF